jgi:hypothetical protein
VTHVKALPYEARNGTTPNYGTDIEFASIGEREFLLVEDEVAGAVGTGQCPNGGVHVYDTTGENEHSPVKVGYWNIDEVRATTSPTHSCTAHVFDIHGDAKVMTIAYYNGGVRVVDNSGLVGISLGGAQLAGQGMREIGFYRFDAQAAPSASDGAWLTPAQALARANARPKVKLTASSAFFCLLKP